VGNILGIDLGTSGCKLVILDEDGKLLATTSQEVHPTTNADGTVEQDPNDWYGAPIAGLRLLESRGADLGAISAVGVDGQMQGITLVNRDCDPVRDSILWNDTRSDREFEWLKSRDQERIEDTIGCPLSTGLTITKILWLQAHEPDSWRKTHKFMHAANFLIAKLTGEMTADQNNLGQSGLNDFVRNGWSEELLELVGVDPDKVPELRQCFDVIGQVTVRAAAETGLRAGTPVVAAGGDSAAESYSIALAGSDRMKIRLGTAGDMNVVVHFDSLDPRRLRGIRDVLPDYVLFGAYTRACASSVKWARSLFYSDLPLAESTYVRMDADASTVAPGSDGLLYFPYLNGEASPYFNSHISAKFLGIRAGMGRHHFARAVYEGVSFSLRDVIRSTREFDFARRFVVVGGGAKSSLWVTILADVLGHDTLVPRNCDAAFGAALIAGDGTGSFDGRAAAAANVDDHVRVAPDPGRHAIYDEGFERYLEFAGR
jgi:xylulokinase